MRYRRSARRFVSAAFIVLFASTFLIGIKAAPGQVPAQEALSAPPGVPIVWSRLPQVTQGRHRVLPRLSDVDQATLRRLKRQPFVVPPVVPYKVTVDRTTRPVSLKPLAPAVITNFQGPTQLDNGMLTGFLARPPDPDIAVGPGHVGVVTNILFTVYSKTGTELAQTPLASWFSAVCSTCDPFDPRIAYDTQENRWILIALHQEDSGVSRILLSVSATSNPTGTWYAWNLDGVLNHPGPPAANTWADYPDVGFDGILSTASPSGAIYITANQFTFPPYSFRTATLYILSKAELYAGTVSLNFWRAYDRLNSDGSQAATLRTAKTYGNPGWEYLINSRNLGNFLSLWKVIPTYPPTPVNWTLQSTITIGSFSFAPDAPQYLCPGGETLDTIDNRLYNAVWRNNRIYTAFTQAFDWGTPATTEAAIRYLKIKTSTPAVAEINTVFGADNTFYFMPAITTDAVENIALVYARSSASEFAGVHFTGHRIGAPGFETPALLKGGDQCITGFRWGDYFGAALEPTTINEAWIFGEWAAENVEPPGQEDVWDWSTWIGRVQFTPTFADVPTSDFGYARIEQMYNRAITAGCSGPSPLLYCPDNNVLRRQMAIFIIKAMGITPPLTCSGTFADVPPTDLPYCRYIEQMYTLGITSGCAGPSPLLYCPDNNVLRRQMAIFIIKGMGLTPPPGCAGTFADVPATDLPYCRYIEMMATLGITAGCAPSLFCPDNNVTRREMAVFIIRGFFP